MDRGYDNTATGHGAAHKPLGQAIKEHIPGTEENRMRNLGVTGHHHDTAGHHVGAGVGGAHPNASMGERVKAAIPGTDEYEVTHGMTGAHKAVEQAKAYVPGTEEHRVHEATRPMGTGVGHDHTHGTGYTGGAGLGGHAGTAGATGYGAAGTGYGSAGTPYSDTAGMGTMGAGEGVGAHKTVGQKIKEVIPGTREHEAKKMEQGRF